MKKNNNLSAKKNDYLIIRVWPTCYDSGSKFGHVSLELYSNGSSIAYISFHPDDEVNNFLGGTQAISAIPKVLACFAKNLQDDEKRNAYPPIGNKSSSPKAPSYEEHLDGFDIEAMSREFQRMKEAKELDHWSIAGAQKAHSCASLVHHLLKIGDKKNLLLHVPKQPYFPTHRAEDRNRRDTAMEQWVNMLHMCAPWLVSSCVFALGILTLGYSLHKKSDYYANSIAQQFLLSSIPSVQLHSTSGQLIRDNLLGTLIFTPVSFFATSALARSRYRRIHNAITPADIRSIVEKVKNIDPQDQPSCVSKA